MIWESIKMVFKMFKTNKLRTLLTMLGIVIGIFSISMIYALSSATKTTMESEIASLEYQGVSILITNEENDYLKYDLIDNELKNYLSNKDITKYYTKIFNFEYEYLTNLTELENTSDYYYNYGSYIGIDSNYYKLYPTVEKNLLYGRLIENKDVANAMNYALIREDSAEILFGKKNVVGETLNINNHQFEIIGVLALDMDDYYTPNIAVPVSYLEKYDDSYYVIRYDFMPQDNTNAKELENNIKELLSKYVPKSSIYISTMDMEAIMAEMESIISMIELIFVGIASLSIIVGGIGIMNIMLVSVNERIKETGIRMALGAKRKYIVFQFLIEGIILTLLSGIIGLLLASGLSYLINMYLTTTEFALVLSISLSTVIKVTIYCGIIGIVFGIYPSWKAGKLDPVEALKYE